jgi:hypothetical protein
MRGGLTRGGALGRIEFSMSSEKLPSGTGLGESVGGTLGMLLSLCGVGKLVLVASPHHWAQASLIAAGVPIFIISMIGGSILGSTIAARWHNRAKNDRPKN